MAVAEEDESTSQLGQGFGLRVFSVVLHIQIGTMNTVAWIIALRSNGKLLISLQVAYFIKHCRNM